MGCDVKATVSRMIISNTSICLLLWDLNGSAVSSVNTIHSVGLKHSLFLGFSLKIEDKFLVLLCHIAATEKSY